MQKGSPPAPAKQSLRERIQEQLGDTPMDDSLAAVTWISGAVGRAIGPLPPAVDVAPAPVLSGCGTTM